MTVRLFQERFLKFSLCSFFVCFFLLWCFICMFICFIAGTVLSLLIPLVGAIVAVLLYVLCGLALFLPSLAACVRRLHDIGKSGVFCLISLIPCVGLFILLILMCKASQVENNQYGPNPHNYSF